MTISYKIHSCNSYANIRYKTHICSIYIIIKYKTNIYSLHLIIKYKTHICSFCILIILIKPKLIPIIKMIINTAILIYLLSVMTTNSINHILTSFLKPLAVAILLISILFVSLLIFLSLLNKVSLFIIVFILLPTLLISS